MNSERRARQKLGAAMLGGWVVLVLGCGRVEPRSEAAPTAATTAAPTVDATARPEGFVVWESNRSGAWRLWRAALDGSGLRQLSRDEKRREHCCAHVSPDGRQIAYLSLPHGQETYPESGAAGELRLIAADGSGERVLAQQARTYFEHRAAVWRSPEELIFIDERGRTVLREVASGRRELLTERGEERHGWLIDATLSWASQGAPTFSRYDRARRTIEEAARLGGCQPFFSHDGRWGFWIAGAGGPLRKIELATRKVGTVLRKSDPRLPGDRGYFYFPMFSSDGMLLAFAASGGDHDHHTADYDVFVAETDPKTLEILGEPWRVAPHPAVDRFPDVFFAPSARNEARARPAPIAVPAETWSPPEAPGWPTDRGDLAFLWQTHTAANLGLLKPAGRAWLDRNLAMELHGGSFVADEASVLRIFEAARATNELTVELTLTPARADQRGPARIFTFSSNDRARNFTLGQEGDHLVFRLRTATTGQNADQPQIDLGAIPAGRPSHVVLAYTPGRLVYFLDGEKQMETAAIQDGFFHWKPRPMLLGNEWEVARPWLGTIEGVAVYGRFMGEEEARENARRYHELRTQRPAIPRLRVSAELVALSKIPTLESISPYREALAVYEYRVLAVLEGSYAEKTVRVVHRVLHDGERLPAAEQKPGTRTELVLEPFSAQPQLESLYLSETLAENYSLELFFALGSSEAL